MTPQYRGFRQSLNADHERARCFKENLNLNDVVSRESDNAARHLGIHQDLFR